MFFSLIEASNQVLPKTKVVDFLFLYNFYFGQISSSNINYFFEFWIVKFGSKSFKCVHCASLTTGPACHLLVSSRSSRIASVLKSSTAPLSLTAPPLSRACATMVVAATSRATPLPPRPHRASSTRARTPRAHRAATPPRGAHRGAPFPDPPTPEQATPLASPHPGEAPRPPLRPPAHWNRARRRLP